MDNKVQKFDPSKLMEGVKERIRAEFASLIPDEAWTQMVEKEVQSYFHDKFENSYRHDRTSRFEDLVRSLLQEETKKRFAVYISSAEFERVWGKDGLPACSEAVKKMIVDNSGEILISFFGGMFQGMLDNFKANLQNHRY